MIDERDDWLEQSLRDHDRYVSDDGFSARVMAGLPPPRRARDLRFWVLALSTLIAWTVAFVLLPGAELLMRVAQDLLSYRPGSVSFPLTALVVAATLVAAGASFVEAE